MMSYIFYFFTVCLYRYHYFIFRGIYQYVCSVCASENEKIYVLRQSKGTTPIYKQIKITRAQIIFCQIQFDKYFLLKLN